MANNVLGRSAFSIYDVIIDKIPTDDTLDATSENPISNKAVTEQVNSINRQITDINEDITDINSIVGGHTTSINTINGQITDINSDITTTNSNVTTNTNSINTINGQITDINSDITDINTTVGNHATSIESINGQITDINAALDSKGNTNALIFKDKVVATTDWVDSTVDANYPYQADIVCTGVTENYYPEVTFATTDATSGLFAPSSDSYTGVVRIYATEVPSADITVPTIICFLVQEV